MDYDPIPKYVNNIQLSKDKLSLPANALEEIAANADPLISTFHLVDDFREVSADNFQLEAKIRTVYQDKWAVCQRTRIVILGTTGDMIIPFSIPGCVSDIGLMLNDVFLSGKKHDLSAFGVELNEFREITIKVQEKTSTGFVDQNEIYSGSYNTSVGRLVGMRFRFLGAGEVKDLKVTNARGKVILEEG